MTKQQLIEDNMRLVTYIIDRYYPTFLSDEDIFQTGMMGLCMAANTWDESKSAFSTYASSCILNVIKNEFRSRKKHDGVLSLDYKYSNYDKDNTTLKDVIVGQDDIDYADVDFIYENLNPVECKIVDCRRRGMTTSDIAREFGCSRQNISKKLRRIKSKIK